MKKVTKTKLSPDLIRRLVKNTIETLLDRYGDDGCNDICDDEPVLKGVSKAELKEIEKVFVEKFPKEAADCEGELFSNTQILEVLLKLT